MARNGSSSGDPGVLSLSVKFQRSTQRVLMSRNGGLGMRPLCIGLLEEDLPEEVRFMLTSKCRY